MRSILYWGMSFYHESFLCLRDSLRFMYTWSTLTRLSHRQATTFRSLSCLHFAVGVEKLASESNCVVETIWVLEDFFVELRH